MPSDRLAQRKDGTTDPIILRARTAAQAILEARIDGDQTREEALYERLLASDDDKIVLETLKFLKSYAYGRPAQLVEHTGKDGGDIQVFHNVPRPQKQIGSAITVEVIDAVRE